MSRSTWLIRSSGQMVRLALSDTTRGAPRLTHAFYHEEPAQLHGRDPDAAFNPVLEEVTFHRVAMQRRPNPEFETVDHIPFSGPVEGITLVLPVTTIIYHEDPRRMRLQRVAGWPR